KIVPGRDLGLLVVEPLFERLLLQLQTLRRLLELRIGVLVLEADFEPFLTRQLVEVLRRDLRAGLQLARTTRRSLSDEHSPLALVEVIFQDALLISEVLADALDLSLLDRQCTRVLVDTIACEHANVDDRAVHSGRYTQARVLNVRGLLTEDGAQQLLFRSQLG